MNVIVTAHSKNEYGDEMKIVGKTFDGWKRLDYLFDLVFELTRTPSGKSRVATVRKSRLEEFPDQESFDWSYDELARRYGADKLERQASVISLADDALVDEFKRLYEKLSEAEIKRLKISRVVSSVDDVKDLTSDRVEKGIEIMKTHLGVK